MEDFNFNSNYSRLELGLSCFAPLGKVCGFACAKLAGF